MICPSCEQGELLHVRIIPLDLEGFICDECEGFWEGSDIDDIDIRKGTAFQTRMEEKQLFATWDQLEIL
jgi:hypothetical protein